MARRQRWAAEKLARQTEEAAINVIFLKLESSAILAQPQLAPLVEVTRQVYNHRDFLYEVLLEIKSEDSSAKKINGIAKASVTEIGSELSNYLVGGGIAAVSSQLKQAGFFRQPFGPKGIPLDDTTANALQSFLEGTLTTLIQR